MDAYIKSYNPQEEPLLADREQRMTTFPIEDEEFWEYYKKARDSYWTPGEIDLGRDLIDFNNLKEGEKKFLIHVLTFFASADTLVNNNLATDFSNQVTVMEANYFLSFQIAIENIHSEMYSLLLDNLLLDIEEKKAHFNALQEIPSIKRKGDWAMKWIDSKIPFPIRVVAFVIVEGLFFSGSFASIFWFKEKGILPGVTSSNEFISRDEGLHYTFGIAMYRRIKQRIPEKVIMDMMLEAVEIEKDFFKDALPKGIIGMNANLIGSYIEYMADFILTDLGLEKHFYTQNPFPFMTQLSIPIKGDFFSRRITEYSMPITETGNVTYFE